jgi:hypothetical protein
LDTPLTHNTPIGPLSDEGRTEGGYLSLDFLGNEFLMVNPEAIGQILKLAFTACVAHRAIQGVIYEHQPQCITPHLLHPFCFGMDYDTIDHGRRTGDHGLFRTFDLHKTHSTGAQGTQSLVEAEGGDRDAMFRSGLQYRLLLARGNHLIVDRKLHHSRSPSTE